MTPAQEYRNGVRAAVLLIAGLCGLCVLASLSGCLTATKIQVVTPGDSGGPV